MMLKKQIKLLILFSLIFASCSGIDIGGAAGGAKRTPTPLQSAIIVQISQDYQITTNKLVGNVEVEYPKFLTPNGSSAISTNIYIPNDFETLEASQEFKDLEVPADQPVGEFSTRIAHIYIASEMSVEFDSPTLTSSPQKAALQPVDIHSIDSKTNWSWLIAGPEDEGVHTFSIRVYIPEIDTHNPSWVGFYSIKVEKLQSEITPAQNSNLTATTIDAVWEIVVGVMTTAIVGLGGGFFVKKKAKSERSEEIISYITRIEEKKLELSTQLAEIRTKQAKREELAKEKSGNAKKEEEKIIRAYKREAGELENEISKIIPQIQKGKAYKILLAAASPWSPFKALPKFNFEKLEKQK